MLGYSHVGLRHSCIFLYKFPLDGFQKAVAYALQRLNSPNLQLKPGQENSLRALYSGKMPSFGYQLDLGSPFATRLCSFYTTASSATPKAPA